MNKVHLVGNVGNVNESVTTTGKAVITVSVATEEYWTDRNGEPRKRTDWHRVVAFDKIATRAGLEIEVGDRVEIIGRNQTRKYEKDGQTHYITEVIAMSIEKKML